MEFCPNCNIGLSTPEKVGGYCNNCGHNVRSNNTYETDKALRNKDFLIQCLNEQVDSLKRTLQQELHDNEMMRQYIKELEPYKQMYDDKFPAPMPKWDGVCRCGHKHSEHGGTLSINYTAGRCSIKGCDCLNFLMPSSEQVAHGSVATEVPSSNTDH